MVALRAVTKNPVCSLGAFDLSGERPPTIRIKQLNAHSYIYEKVTSIIFRDAFRANLSSPQMHDSPAGKLALALARHPKGGRLDGDLVRRAYKHHSGQKISIEES